MWPFKKKRKIKPLLNGIWLDLYTSDGERTIKLESKMLYDILTTEQIEYLNSLVPEQVEPAVKTFQEAEKELIRKETEEIAEAKRKPVTDEARLNHEDNFAQYFLNNKDQAILSPDEQEKLSDMFANIEKRRAEMTEQLKKAEARGDISPLQRKAAEKFSELFLDVAKKSAKNGGK